MPRSQGTFHKKEIAKRKQQKRKEKEQRKEERKANAKEGKTWEDMIAYVDENGNISSTPPDPTKKKPIKQEDIVTGSRNYEEQGGSRTRTGKVLFFNTSKGFGFIKDAASGESIFVHTNALLTPVKENDMVTFETMKGLKGLNAVKVKTVE